MNIVNYETKESLVKDGEALYSNKACLTQSIKEIKVKICKIDPNILSLNRFDSSSYLKIMGAIIGIFVNLYYSFRSVWYRSAAEDLKSSLSELKAEKLIVKNKILQKIGQVTGAITSLNASKTNLDEKLSEVMDHIRSIDPTLLGEQRYDRASQPALINFILDLYYNQFYQKINRLLEKKVDLESKLNDVSQKLQILSQFLHKHQKKEGNLGAPREAEGTSFDRLKISEEQRNKLRVLIPSVANDTILQLIPKLTKIFEAKRKLDSLHPLKSLEDILKDKDLRKALFKMKEDKEKWVGRTIFFKFIPGFLPQTAEKIKKYHAEGTIIPCLSGFISSLGLNEAQGNQLTKHAQDQQWEEFLKTLVSYFE